MPIIPANLDRITWTQPYPGAFHPNGPVLFFGDKDVFARGAWRKHGNPTQRTRVDIAAIRFFIGFNVASKPRWKVSDVERIVSAVRIRQMGAPDATFVAQLGTYTHQSGKRIVKEKGCQVIIMNMPHWGVTTDEFRDQMEELGEVLCQKLKQETILAEWQVNGIVAETWKVTP